MRCDGLEVSNDQDVQRCTLRELRTETRADRDFKKFADVAELVYAYVSEAYGANLEGSSPSIRTRN